MTPLTVFVLATILNLAYGDSYDINYQYENYDKGQPPTGPEWHHFFGQGGYDPFGKDIASLHVYHGPYFDKGPVKLVHQAGHLPSHNSQQGQYSPYRPMVYEVPSYQEYPLQINNNKGKGVFKAVDDKIKDYADKFSKFVSGYMTYSQPSYSSSYESHQLTYYEQDDSFTKKLSDGAEKVKYELEKFGEKAAYDLKKFEKEAKDKLKDLFVKEEEHSYGYGPPQSSYGAPLHYEEEHSFTKKLGKELAKTASKMKYEFEKIGEKAAKEFHKIEDEASKKMKGMTQFMTKIDDYVGNKMAKEMEKGQAKLDELEAKIMPKLIEFEQKAAKGFQKIEQKANRELVKFEAKATKKLKDIFESDYDYYAENPKGNEKGIFKIFHYKGKEKKNKKPNTVQTAYGVPQAVYGAPQATYGVPQVPQSSYAA